MTAKDRVTLIRDLAQKNRRVLVSELSEICEVTEETIRKDLNKLETEGVITRVHGGVIINEQFADDSGFNSTGNVGIHFNQRKNVNRVEKQIIAARVSDLIQNGNTLFVDSSTTVAEALAALPDGMELTLVTNSTYIFMECATKDINIISTGGEFNQKYLSLQGTVAKECISKYNVDYALISCKALDMDRGVQDSNEGEAEIKKMMISQSRKVILLADHTKFDQTAFVQLMNFDEVDYLVTDMEPDDKWKRFCNEHHVQLIC